MWQQIDQLLFCSFLNPAKNITQILYRIQFMIADISKNRLKSCKSNPSFEATYEETIVTVFSYSTDLLFTTII